MSVHGPTREFLAQLAATRARVDALAQTTGARSAAGILLQRIDTRLSRPLRVILLGEPNAGKSSLVNALIDHECLMTDVIRNTRLPTVVRHAPSIEARLRRSNGEFASLSMSGTSASLLGPGDVVELGLPIPALVHRALIDTPGLQPDDATAPWLTTLLAEADIAIWCTLAPQAWRATERNLWMALPRRLQRSSLMVATHSDGLDSTDREKLHDRLARDAGGHFAGFASPSAATSSVRWPTSNRSLTTLRRGVSKRPNR